LEHLFVGSMVSWSGSIDCLKWVRSFVLSNSNRMAPGEKEHIWKPMVLGWILKDMR
jgi:hypothetical protein